MNTQQTNTTNITPDQHDKQLWRLARKRAAFKAGLLAYVLVNAFLVAVWYFTSNGHTYFWPMWPMLGWGLGMTFQYLGAYHESKVFSPEREYEKLKNEYKQ